MAKITIKVISGCCNREIDFAEYDVSCPQCGKPFLDEELIAWDEQLEAASKGKKATSAPIASPEQTAPVEQTKLNPKARYTSENKSSDPEPEPDKQKILINPDAGGNTNPANKSENSGSEYIYEYRGEPFKKGQERDACRFILKKALYNEIVDKDGVINQKNTKIFAFPTYSCCRASGAVHTGNAHTQISKFYAYMYQDVFRDVDMPLIVKSGGEIKTYASGRELFFNKVFKGEIDAALLRDWDVKGILCAYLNEGIAGSTYMVIRERLNLKRKFCYLDQNYTVTPLGSRADLCALDGLTSLRYEVLKELSNEALPMDDFNENAKIDSAAIDEFCGVYGAESSEMFFRKYMFLASISIRETGICAPFGIKFRRDSIAEQAKGIIEGAAVGKMRQFILLRALFAFKVFGRPQEDGYPFDYHAVIGSKDISNAADAAYQSLKTVKKLIMYGGNRYSATDLARHFAAKEPQVVFDLLSSGSEFFSALSEQYNIQGDFYGICKKLKNTIEGEF